MWHWSLISRFGETSLLLPCALLLYLWLRHGGEPRAARLWFACFTGAATVTLLSKLAFMGWGIGMRSLDFTGLSGHSMMASATLPVLLHRFAPPQRAWLAALCGLAAALLIGYSRLMLQVHSPSEVAGGLLTGMSASIAFLSLSARTPRRGAPVLLSLAIATLMLALPASGLHAPTHAWLEQFAMYLSGRDRPFRREDWPARIARVEPASIAAHLPRHAAVIAGPSGVARR